MAKKAPKLAIGVDIGGSGIKGAPVNLKTGEFAAERLRIPTPPNGDPEVLAGIVKEIVESFEPDDDLAVGVCIPGPVVHGVIPMMANLSKKWEGTNAQKLFEDTLGREVLVVNDADAAGYAEVEYGVAKREGGTSIVLTLGTGIGSALVRDGILIPNTELGHIILPNGKKAEKWAASSIKTAEDLSFEEWAERLQEVFSQVEMLFSPDVFVIGGGVSKKHKKFVPLIKTRAEIVPAKLFNAAGIVGSATLAHRARYGK
ncbi:MAG: ROK family protein [Actinomycetaceae bacterium]|nr:ROK family protein [Arcanobacterium sp.]MDD7504772.1 ROK family protein [Actinomycetaceae bacterium]MDY6143557.1 ROK family protein [Arcanobacterium sp.]